MSDQSGISLSGALGAREIIRPHLRPAPLRNYPSLDRLIGARVFLKHENHNPTGTFKIRGGLNLMHHLAREGVAGVVTYSTGNHGTSVAASAKRFGLRAVVVVPQGSNPLKVQAIKDAGAELIEHGADFEAAGKRWPSWWRNGGSTLSIRPTTRGWSTEWPPDFWRSWRRFRTWMC